MSGRQKPERLGTGRAAGRVEHDPLAELIQSETFAEVLKLLRPDEAFVALLRAQGYSDAEIARRIGVARSTVTWRMIRARRRIARDLPEAARWLLGRRRRRRRCSRRSPDR